MPQQRGKGAAPAGKQPEQDAETLRVTKIIEELSTKVPAKVSPYVKQAAPVLATAWVYFMIALPYIVEGITKVQELVMQLPEKIVYAILGFCVCFFGGIFPATIAAAEAWQLCGGCEAIECCKQLYNEFKKVQDANDADDKKDANKDGKPDVQQMAPKELIVHKAQVALKAVNPDTVSDGIVGLYTGWVGVLAILKIKFAKTVTLGEKIGEQLYEPAKKFEPMIEGMVPEEYRKWVPVAVRWTCKVSAITVAWWVSRVISAFHSAIRGGLLFGKYLVDYLHERGILKSDSSAQSMDEAIGWGVALAGLLFQFATGFGVPFPFNLVLWPLQLLEAFIVWSVAAS
uniref:Uncharacterized protein n=1 Tax=Strombidinopsis acuminata TaxID=141414 RepID=A0A7S3WUS9_9SPIT